MEDKICYWAKCLINPWLWVGACGYEVELGDSDYLPKDQDFNYCPRCGGTIKEKPLEEWKAPDE